MVEYKNAVTGEKFLRQSQNRLTPENVLLVMDEKLKDKKPCLDTMVWLSYFLEFAISTKNLMLIDKVHSRIDRYYFDNFS